MKVSDSFFCIFVCFLVCAYFFLKKKSFLECWDGDPDKRPTIQEVVITLKSMMSSLDSKDLEPVKNLSPEQQIIQQYKLNHGLFLDGCSIKLSKQAIFVDDGE